MGACRWTLRRLHKVLAVMVANWVNISQAPICGVFESHFVWTGMFYCEKGDLVAHKQQEAAHF